MNRPKESPDDNNFGFMGFFSKLFSSKIEEEQKELN
jgi:hypothetical protein